MKYALSIAALILIGCGTPNPTRPGDDRPPLERPDTLRAGLCDTTGCP